MKPQAEPRVWDLAIEDERGRDKGQVVEVIEKAAYDELRERNNECLRASLNLRCAEQTERERAESAEEKLEKWDQEREDWMHIFRSAEAERDAAVELLRELDDAGGISLPRSFEGRDDWSARFDAFLAAQEKP